MSDSPFPIRPEALAYKPPKPKKELKLPKGKKLFIIVFAIVVLEGAATQIYLVTHRNPPPKIQNTIQTEQTEAMIPPEAEPEQKKQAEVIVEAVEKQVKLPEGEEPVMATVSDPAALKNQKFFSAAQVGDKILMYRIAKKVFLYRPATDKVIAQAPLKFDEGAVSGASTSVSVTPSSVPL